MQQISGTLRQGGSTTKMPDGNTLSEILCRTSTGSSFYITMASVVCSQASDEKGISIVDRWPLWIIDPSRPQELIYLLYDEQVSDLLSEACLQIVSASFFGQPVPP